MQSIKTAEQNFPGLRYSGAALCDGAEVSVGPGRKRGMCGTMAATSDGWTDTSILRVSDADVQEHIDEADQLADEQE